MPDPITHLCLSYIIARHFFKNDKALFILSGISPDIDVAVGGFYILLTGPWPKSFYEFTQHSLVFHPTVTSSFIFIPFFALLLLCCFYIIRRSMVEVNVKKAYGIILGGICFHVFLDLLQTGNLPLWPFEFEAGFNILPYSAMGRGLTILGAIALVVFDLLISKYFFTIESKDTKKI